MKRYVLFGLLMMACLCMAAQAAPRQQKEKPRAAKQTVVEARGEAAIENGDLAAARAEARRRAMQDAVDQVYGSFIQSANETTNNKMDTDRVYSQLQGLVTDFKELSEKRDGAFLTLTARCTVVKRDATEVLGPAMLDAMGNPRVAVLVDHWTGDKKDTLSGLESTIHSIFAKSGYLMVDSRQLASNNRAPEALKDLEAGDTTLMRSLLSQMGADVIVYARSRSMSLAKGKISGITVYSVNNDMTITATAVSNAYQLGEVHGETRTEGVSVNAAAEKGVAELGSGLARKLAGQVPWNILEGRKNSIAGRTLTVTVKDIPFSTTRTLINKLDDSTDVETLHQREYRHRTLVLDVTTKGTAAELAILLEREGAEVTEVTDGAVAAQWKTKTD